MKKLNVNEKVKVYSSRIVGEDLHDDGTDREKERQKEVKNEMIV